MDRPATNKLLYYDIKQSIEIRNVVGVVYNTGSKAVNLLNNLTSDTNPVTRATERIFYTLTQIDYDISISGLSGGTDNPTVWWAIAVLQDDEVLRCELPLDLNGVETNIAYEPFTPADKLAKTGAGIATGGAVYRATGTIKGNWDFINGSKINFYVDSPEGYSLKGICNAKIYLLP